MAEAFHHHHPPLQLNHLFRPPLVRQYVQGKSAFSNPGELKETYVELFFDLAFVGIIHQLADGAVHPEPSWWNVLKFILGFYTTSVVHISLVQFLNHSGSDDISSRLFVLLQMLLLLGLGVNLAGIELVHEEGAATHIAPESYPAINASVAYLLLALLSYFFLFLTFSLYLHKSFRPAYSVKMLKLVIPIALWARLIWIDPGENSDRIILGLGITAIVAQMGLDWFVAIFWGAFSRAKPQRLARWSFPAVNISHMMERMTSFVVIVLGESVINATFAAAGEEIGIDQEYGRAALGVIIAFEILWLYVDADSSRLFIHALRRNWATSILFIHLHWPLCGALILSSAAEKEMVLNVEVEQGYRWYFSGGLGFVVLVTAVLGMAHRSLDKAHSALLPRSVRLILRVLVAILFFLLPLTPNHSTTLTLGYHAAILAVLIIVETAGKLGAEGDFTKLHVHGAGNVQPFANGKTRQDRHERVLVELEDLTEREKGEEDAGVEGGINQMHVKDTAERQKLALMA